MYIASIFPSTLNCTLNLSRVWLITAKCWVDEMTVDKAGVDKTGVDKLGINRNIHSMVQIKCPWYKSEGISNTLFLCIMPLTICYGREQKITKKNTKLYNVAVEMSV